MSRLNFYLRYAATHLRNNGQWTAFAVFCVAAGVATVVALRSLGLAITDSLLSNLRQYNHGDINISSVSSAGPFSVTFQRGADEPSIFRPQQVEAVRNWAAGRNATISEYIVASNIQITPAGQEQAGKPQFTSSFLIDPATFDQSAPIIALDPPNTPLRDLFKGGREVVISRNLADDEGLKVGDPVRVSGTEETFTVAGIVPTETEASINNVFAAFFGFAYFDRSQAEVLQLNANPNTIGIVLPDGTPGTEIEAAANEIMQVVRVRDINATPWLLSRNALIADMIGRFIVTMGLGALLIGGVGIMNTMLVLVGRRSMEIAALKTFGLKGRQVAALFISEAFLLGLLGSAVGIVAGLLLSGVVNAYGEAFLQQRLPLRVHGEALFYGVTLGMIVTLVFGVLPVLMATKVRPAIVLRPNETHLPRAGLIQSFIALSVIVIVLGLVAGQIISPIVGEMSFMGSRYPMNPYAIGIVLVALVLFILALLTGVMWVVVWLVGHMPTFGAVDLHLALRNLSTRRVRTATTLLALTAGMFALSSISYFGMGAREIVRIQFAQTLGGNVMIVPLLPRGTAQPFLDVVLAQQEGVQYRTILNLNAGRITGVNGAPVQLDGGLRQFPLSLMTRDTDNPALTSGPLIAGRDLQPDDRGKNVIVMSEQTALGSLMNGFDSLESIGITVGSKVAMRVSGQSMIFEVIGIVGSANGLTPNIAGAFLPPDVPGITQNYLINIVQVEPDKLNTFLTNLSAMPLVFALDVSFLDGLLKRLVDQLSAVPIVVGLLSLLAAAVIMANTVSLTVLERRRQIGILKALGLKRRRVLWVMLLENTVIGLLGGLLGIGVSALGVSVMTLLGAGAAIPIPNDARLLTIGLLIASVVIAWVATLLSARVATSERVTQILRYE